MGPCVVEACAWEHGRLGNDDWQVLVRTQLPVNKRTGDWYLRGIRGVLMQAYAAANPCQELGARHGAAWRNVQALACVPTSVRTDDRPGVRAGMPLCRRMRPGRQLSARTAERSNLDGTACIFAVHAYHVGVVSLSSEIGTQGQDRDHDGAHVRKGSLRVVGA
jgi:hypothetical protein